MEKAFREAIDDIKSEIVLKEVVERLERQDIEGAIAALHIDPVAFRPLSEAIREAFSAGGLLVTQNMPRLSDPAGARVVVRWDVGNQRAEQIIREQSSKLITHVTEDTKAMAREAIHAGYAQGQGPRTIALDLAGRVNRVTQRREGGLIGLTSQLARTVENARAALLSGDVVSMKHYLTLTRRDKRFDRQSPRRSARASRFRLMSSPRSPGGSLTAMSSSAARPSRGRKRSPRSMPPSMRPISRAWTGRAGIARWSPAAGALSAIATFVIRTSS